MTLNLMLGFSTIKAVGNDLDAGNDLRDGNGMDNGNDMDNGNYMDTVNDMDNGNYMDDGNNGMNKLEQGIQLNKTEAQFNPTDFFPDYESFVIYIL